MNQKWQNLFTSEGPVPARAYGVLAFLALTLAMVAPLLAVENIPQKPFAQSVWLPPPGQFLITPWYQYSEFFHIWRGSKRESIEVDGGHDSHGFDQNDGMILLDYGLAAEWAADLTLGYTAGATRSFDLKLNPHTSQGAVDTTFGLRYQAFTEETAVSRWTPTLTLRAGGIYRGTYNPEFPFAPGNGSVGIEPSVLANKRFGWEGLGAYGHMGYRWMRSGGSDQWFAALGLFQKIKQFELNVGYRHFGNIAGSDIGGSGTTIIYSRFVRERKEEILGGVGYTSSKRAIHTQFYLGKVIDGRNTGSALNFGLYADFPVGR